MKKIKQILLKFPFLFKIGLVCKRILRNIKFLLTENLYQVANNYDVEILKYELANELPKTKIPQIKSVEETFSMLIESNCSFCRFGDGEFENIMELPVPFSNVRLKDISKRLIEILNSENPKICVGLPLRMYQNKNNMPKYERIFWRSPYIRNFYRIIGQYCHLDRYYYAAEVTLPFCYEDVNLDLFFANARKIWNNKDITLIAGKGIFKGFTSDIFDNAHSVEYLDAPAKNAFGEYESILKKALKIDKNRLVIIILGQTATVLAYDLALAGYRALDLGHIAKSYDWYNKNKKVKKFSTLKFFAPD